MSGHRHFSVDGERYRIHGTERGPIVESYDGSGWSEVRAHTASVREAIRQWKRNL